MLIQKNTSLFFLLLLTGLITFSCVDRSVVNDKIGHNDKFLDSIYTIATNKSFERPYRLKTLDTLLLYSFKRKNLDYRYKGLMLKTSLLSKFEIDSAISYSIRLKDIAIQNKDSLYIGRALMKLGLYSKRKHDIKKSFEYYNKAFKNFKAINDSVNSAKSLLAMSKIQKSYGDFIGSKNTAIDGLKYMKTLTNKVTYVGFLQNISTSFREEGNYHEALRYNEEALQLFISSKANGILKNTKANLLADQGDYNRAIMILQELQKDSLFLKNENETARVLTSLGLVKWLKNSNNKVSEKLFLSGYAIRKEKMDVRGLISSCIRLTQYYQNKDIQIALRFAEEALGNATKINSQMAQLEALDYIIKLKENPKEEALLYTTIDKKLTNINQQNRELYSVTKYENEKILKEKSIIEADREKKQKLNSWYLFGLITLLLAASLIVIILKNRHTLDKQKKVLDTEKRIAKRIHDELANDVYSSMVQLENNTASVAEVVDNLEGIYHKARDLSQEKTTIRSNKEFIDDLKKSLSSFNTEETNVIVQGLIPDIWIDVSNEKKLIVDRVIKELLVNMRKHSSANLVSVIFSRTKNIIKIRYTDNGVGTYKSEISKGVGLVNAENRIEAIGGSFIFDKSTKKGFKLGVEIPV